MKAVIALTISLIGILCCFQAALADGLFYSGDVVIESVGINIDIDDEEATVNAVYLLKNRGSSEAEIAVQLTQPSASLEVDGETLTNPVVFNPGDRKSINASFSLENIGETTKTLSIDPEMLFDGKPNAEPAGTVLIEALLPEGVYGLAWASREPDEESREGNRIIYTWETIGLYPELLTLKWSTLDIDLSVEKSASPQDITQPDQVINIEITLKNNGDAALSNIRLVDQYVMSDFGEIEPFVESGTKENMIFWQKDISSLGPGETSTANYSVKYIASIPQIYEFDLKPTVVTVDGHLVSVSNKVRMKQTAELPASTPAPQPIKGPETSPRSGDAESENNTWLFVVVGIVLALLIIGAAVYFMRRRKQAN